MKQVFLALAVLIASSSAILNGDLSPHQPFYARVTFRPMEGNQQQILNKAGVIVSDRFVLTTAFFFGNSWDYQVWVGSNIRAHQQSFAGVAMFRVTNHPDGPGVIQLMTPVTFSATVRSIRMVSADSIVGSPHEQGMIVGLGGQTPVTRENLHAAFMRITTQQACAEAYPDRNSTAYFCAFDITRRSDFCPEDRGAGLTVISRGEEFLVGIALEPVCSNLLHARPSLFASIAHFRTRIDEILNGIQNNLGAS